MPVQKGCFLSARKSLNWQRGYSRLLLVERLQSANHPDLDREPSQKAFVPNLVPTLEPATSIEGAFFAKVDSSRSSLTQTRGTNL
jgi:hypothetical protein